MALNKRQSHLRSRYGITEKLYETILKGQQYKCAICKEKTEGSIKLNVDHCHKRGTVRGLLCTPCNSALGGFKDSTQLLYAAIEYLTPLEAQKEPDKRKKKVPKSASKT